MLPTAHEGGAKYCFDYVGYGLRVCVSNIAVQRRGRALPCPLSTGSLVRPFVSASCYASQAVQDSQSKQKARCATREPLQVARHRSQLVCWVLTARWVLAVYRMLAGHWVPAA